MAVVLLAATATFVAVALTGSTDGLQFAPRGETPYSLPWERGSSHLCVQGNQTWATHRGGLGTSWDFWMWPGTVVTAARAGRVVATDLSGRLPGWYDGNRVEIEHEDGTRAFYAHLSPEGRRLRVGARVAAGERIGESGMSGRTLYPHLHFQVRGPGGVALPTSFADVDEPDGVPRVWRSYGAAPGPRAIAASISAIVRGIPAERISAPPSLTSTMSSIRTPMLRPGR